MKNPSPKPQTVGLEKVLKLAEIGFELAQYASYAEIVGALGMNRAQVRKACDDLFRLHCELDKDLDTAEAPMFTEEGSLWDNAIARYRTFSSPSPKPQTRDGE